MCATQMNTSDNPGLWDIQLISWLFCEFNVTAKSLFNRLVLGFMHHTRCARIRFWLDIRYTRELSPGFRSRLPVTIHALVTNVLAGYSCDKHRTCVRTARYRYHKRFSLTGHRFTMSAIHDRCSFPTRENARLDTHTQRQAVTMNPAFDFQDTTSARSSPFSAFR